MTDATPRLALPFIVPGQAQKEMSHNEALTILDMAVLGNVVAVGIDTPPEDPAPGNCWIVGDAPENAWSGHAGALAGWAAGGWRFVAPMEGMRVWIDELQGFAIFYNGMWHIGEIHGRVLVNGEQIIGARRTGIVEPEGGTTVDAEARAAIGAILAVLRGHGLIDTIIL